MEINLSEIRGNSLVRYGFRVLLAKEFGLYLKEQEVEKILLAESCIEVYEDVEEFLEKADGDGIIQNCAVNAIYLKIISVEKSRVKSGIFQEYSMKMDCGE